MIDVITTTAKSNAHIFFLGRREAGGGHSAFGASRTSRKSSLRF
jgi:hypothetical protein